MVEHRWKQSGRVSKPDDRHFMRREALNDVVD
jgi:hypothetical protein